MKESYIRIRCSEQEKAMISAMAEQSGMNMSEYILDLIHSEKKYYHEVEVFAVVRGLNKAKTEEMEKRRKSLGAILVDDHGRASVKVYDKLIRESQKEFGDLPNQPNHYLFLEVGGERVPYPFAMSDWAMFEKKEGR